MRDGKDSLVLVPTHESAPPDFELSFVALFVVIPLLALLPPPLERLRRLCDRYKGAASGCFAVVLLLVAA